MDEALGDFRQTVESAAVRLLLISEEESRARGVEGSWSAKEIVGHLTDDLVFPGYEQDEWVRVQNYQEEPWPLLVELWKAYNLHLWHVMARVPEDARRKPRVKHSLNRIAWQTVSEDAPATLEYLMLDYIAHLKNHLRQVFGEAGD
ncbi:MAG: hypothetical protein LC754_04880 [Acidobacteria bacterium]|nr:hypothetical protein [Acidobacteriota bacterium]